MSNEIIKLRKQYAHGIVGKIVYDPYPQPWDGSEPGQIAYLRKSHYALGTESVSEERMDEIRDKIASGEYLGLPVYAYVHSGATIRCGEAFGDPWDSGQSGFVYCEDPAEAKREFGFDSDEDVLGALRAHVKLHDAYLTGEVYGWVVEDAEGNHLDSCWGYYGDGEVEYITECMDEAAAAHVQEIEAEEAEREYWAARDVPTEDA